MKALERYDRRPGKLPPSPGGGGLRQPLAAVLPTKNADAKHRLWRFFNAPGWGERQATRVRLTPSRSPRKSSAHNRCEASAFFPTKNGGRRPPMPPPQPKSAVPDFGHSLTRSNSGKPEFDRDGGSLWHESRAPRRLMQSDRNVL